MGSSQQNHEKFFNKIFSFLIIMQVLNPIYSELPHKCKALDILHPLVY